MLDTLDTEAADPTEAADLPDDDHSPHVIVGQLDEADEPPEPDPPAPPFPVAAPPGSSEKVTALEVRADAGVGLWHADDAPMCRESRALGGIGRQAWLRPAVRRG